MIIIDKETGLEYEVLALGNREHATHHMNLSGWIKEADGFAPAQVALRLILPRYTFGGVEYEKIGEDRQAGPGEYYLDRGALRYNNAHTNTTINIYPILRHVCGSSD